eukprot:Rhum_TRINITY_DN2722_c0_g1::Rhum_TRINITY_DN2722_c0_g1_i1::g.8119::m.8119
MTFEDGTVRKKDLERRDGLLRQIRHQIHKDSTFGNAKLEEKQAASVASGRPMSLDQSPHRGRGGSAAPMLRGSSLHNRTTGLQPTVEPRKPEGKLITGGFSPGDSDGHLRAGQPSGAPEFLAKPGIRLDRERTHGQGCREARHVPSRKAVNSPVRDERSRRLRASYHEPSTTHNPTPRFHSPTASSVLRHRTQAELNERVSGKRRTDSPTGSPTCLTAHDATSPRAEEAIYMSRSYASPIVKLSSSNSRRWLSSPRRKEWDAADAAPSTPRRRGRSLAGDIGAAGRSSSLPLPGGAPAAGSRSGSAPRSPRTTGKKHAFASTNDSVDNLIAHDNLLGQCESPRLRTGRVHRDGPPDFVPAFPEFKRVLHKRPNRIDDHHRSDILGMDSSPGSVARNDPFLGLRSTPRARDGPAAGTVESPRFGKSIALRQMTDPITHRFE